MQNIPNAEMSPRIVNGVIYWYEGDTFNIKLNISLFDDDGNPVPIAEDAVADVVFKRNNGKEIHRFHFDELPEGEVNMIFTEEISGKFIKGVYSYDVMYSADNRTTIVNDNQVIVE